MIDWSALSAPQAAVLAALIGVLAAVSGQLIGAFINAVTSANQSKKNRELDAEKFLAQLRHQQEAEDYLHRKGAYLDYLSGAQAVVSAITYGVDGISQDVLAVLNELPRSLANLSLVGAPSEVVNAANELLVAVQQYATHGSAASSVYGTAYQQARSACLDSMTLDLAPRRESRDRAIESVTKTKRKKPDQASRSTTDRASSS